MTDALTQSSRILICDYGSHKFKAGLNLNELPKSIFHSLIGRPKYRKCFDQTVSKDVVSPSQKSISLYKTEHPINRGILHKAEHWQSILDKISIDLKISSLSETTIFVLEPLFTNIAQKKMIADYVFEKTQSPNLIFGSQPIMSLYSIGATRGIVVESGHGLTQIAPVFDGFKIDDAFQSVHFAGQDVTHELKARLQKYGVVSKYHMNDYLFNKIKKDICFVHPDPVSERRPSIIPKSINYTLPDNREVEIDGEVQLSPELLFDESQLANGQRPLQNSVKEMLDKLDPFISKRLYEQILLSGGNTQLKNFPERLRRELQKNVASEIRVNFLQQNGKPQLMPWIGAFVMSNMSAFSKSVITSTEYKEQGERVLVEKSI